MRETDPERHHSKAGKRQSGLRVARQFPSSPETGGLATRLAAGRLREAGIALAPLLKKAGFSSAQIDQADVPVSVESQIAFLDLAANALRDEFLGFRLALDCDLRQIGLLYYAMASSETLGDALERAQRYSSIANAGVVIRCLAKKDLTISFRFAGVARHTDRHQIETLVTTIVRICRTLTNRRLVPKAVRLAHLRSNDVSELQKFFGCPTDFGTDADEIVFDKKEGQLHLLGADPYLNDVLLRYCEEALSRRRSNASPLRTRIENTIAPLLPHRKANLGAVARQLGMSVRTLSRRLSEEDLKFAEVLEQFRSDLAEQYLGEPTLSISQIAWLVGYNDVSSFSHACRRWTGMNPVKMRDQLLSADH